MVCNPLRLTSFGTSPARGEAMGVRNLAPPLRGPIPPYQGEMAKGQKG